MEVDLKDSPLGRLALKLDKMDQSYTAPKKPTETGWLDIQLTGCGSHEVPFRKLNIWNENGRQSADMRYRRQGKHAGQDELAPGHYRISATCRAYWGSHGYSYLDEVVGEKGLSVTVRAGQTTKVRMNALSTEDIYRLAIAHLHQQSPLNK
jgi:hypothetical protein